MHLGQTTNGIHSQRIPGPGGQIVKQNWYGDSRRNLGIVCKELILGRRDKTGGKNRQTVCPGLLTQLGKLNGLVCRVRGRTHIGGNAPAGGFYRPLVNLLFFISR